MSIINEMLKDLQKNGKQPPSREQVLKGMRSSVSFELKSHSKNILLLLMVLLLTALLVATLVKVKHRYHLAKLVTPTLSQKPSITPSMLSVIALQTQNGQTTVRFLLNQNTLYHADENANNHTLTILFEKTQLFAAMPQVNYDGSGLKNIEALKDDNGNLKIILQLAPSSKVKQVALNKGGKTPELQVDVSGKEQVATKELEPKASDAVTIVKKAVPQNAAVIQYELALDLANSNKDEEAVELLMDTVSHFPSYTDARELLARLLLQNSRDQEAETILADGLKLEPHNLNLIELQARMFAHTGRYKIAISILEKNAPTLEEDPEYHAFVAALYQQDGQFFTAANLYKQLLRLQANNGKWWFGLGIALENLGQKSQALEAYNNATSIGDLNPELKAYIAGRVHTI